MSTFAPDPTLPSDLEAIDRPSHAYQSEQSRAVHTPAPAGTNSTGTLNSRYYGQGEEQEQGANASELQTADRNSVSESLLSAINVPLPETPEERFWDRKSPSSTTILFEKIDGIKTTAPEVTFRPKTKPPVNLHPTFARIYSRNRSSMSSYENKAMSPPPKSKLRTTAIRQEETPSPAMSHGSSSTKSIADTISELRSMWFESDGDSDGEFFSAVSEVSKYDRLNTDHRLHGLGICIPPPLRSSSLPSEGDNGYYSQVAAAPPSPTCSSIYSQDADDEDDAPRLKRSLTPLGRPARHYHISASSEGSPFSGEKPSSINHFQPPPAWKFGNNTRGAATYRPAPIMVNRKPTTEQKERLPEESSPETEANGSSIATKSPDDSLRFNNSDGSALTTPASATAQSHKVGSPSQDEEKIISDAAASAGTPSIHLLPASPLDAETHQAIQATPPLTFAERMQIREAARTDANSKVNSSPTFVSQEYHHELFRPKAPINEAIHFDRFPHVGFSPSNSSHISQWTHEHNHRPSVSTYPPLRPRLALQAGPHLTKAISLDNLRPAPPPKISSPDEDNLHPALRTCGYFNKADKVLLADVPDENEEDDAFPPTPSTPMTPHPRRTGHRHTRSNSALKRYEATKLEPTYEVEARLDRFEPIPHYPTSPTSSHSYHSVITSPSSPTTTSSPPTPFSRPPQALRMQNSSSTLGSATPRFQAPPNLHRRSQSYTVSSPLSPYPRLRTPNLNTQVHTPTRQISSPVLQEQGEGPQATEGIFRPHPNSGNGSPHLRSQSEGLQSYERFESPRAPPMTPVMRGGGGSREVYVPTGAPVGMGGEGSGGGTNRVNIGVEGKMGRGLGKRGSLMEMGKGVGKNVKKLFRSGGK